MSEDGDAIAFAEKVLLLLEQGRRSTTYKYAVLLGLIELCLEGFTRSRHAPESVTSRQLAEKVTELYWPHTRPFGDGGRVLSQSGTGEAEVLSLITRFRASIGRDPMAPLGRARAADRKAFERLLSEIEWKLVEMPLPRLQCFGAQEDRFIYEIDWKAGIRKREFGDVASFSNIIRFVGRAGDHLVRLAGVLRPLLQRRWAAEVARLNADLIRDSELDEFLFGVERVALQPVASGLRELQDNRCFYCDQPLRQAQVDHFLPWARVPLDAIENLVVADASCNGQKRDFLAAAEHVERWRRRQHAHGREVAEIAARVAWDVGAARVLGVARALYLMMPPTARLWRAGADFVPADLNRLEVALS